MIFRELLHYSIAQQISPAVTNMSDRYQAALRHGAHNCGSHASTASLHSGHIEDFTISLTDGCCQQPALRRKLSPLASGNFLLCRFGHLLENGADRQAACYFACLSPAHSVGHHKSPRPGVISEIIFIIRAHRSNVAFGGYADPEHATSPGRYVPGLYICQAGRGVPVRWKMRAV